MTGWSESRPIGYECKSFIAFFETPTAFAKLSFLFTTTTYQHSQKYSFTARISVRLCGFNLAHVDSTARSCAMTNELVSRTLEQHQGILRHTLHTRLKRAILATSRLIPPTASHGERRRYPRRSTRTVCLNRPYVSCTVGSTLLFSVVLALS